MGIPMTNIEKLSKADFTALRDLIYDKSGLFFSDTKLYFVESRLKRRLMHLGLEKYSDYIAYIQKPLNKGELFQLYDAVTTNETSFYRNPPQIDAFTKHILPKVVERIKERGQRTLRIWSAACSSGEEPYTLALMLQEQKDLWRGLMPRIYATDISKEILTKARDGLYQAYTMRNLSPTQISKYFQPEGKDYVVKNELKSLVTFSYFNLVDYTGYSQYRNMDIIFCRNVLIYFDLKVKRNIIKGFHESLNRDSYLLVGHSESLHNVSRDFKMEHFSRALAYLKST